VPGSEISGSDTSSIEAGIGPVCHPRKEMPCPRVPPVSAACLEEQGYSSFSSALASSQAAIAATLTSITVTPANAFVDAGVAQQFTATGHYNDGTTKNITASVTWTSSVVPVAAIAGTGLASANGGGVTAIGATLGTVTGSTSLNVQIPASFFALSINQINEAWPTTQNVQFMTLRTLGSSIKWADLETCEGGPLPTNPCYDWSRLDTWFDKLQPGQDVLFTLYATPSWAS